MESLQTLSTYQELQDRIRNEQAVLFYFSFPDCGVCKSLKPKVIKLVRENFPKLGLYYVDTSSVPEAAGQLSIFAVPAVLVFFQGKELIREARNFGIQELGAKIDRYYALLFGNDG